MGAFLSHLIVELLQIAAATALFGLALRPHFAKTGTPVWKAFVPFYNLAAWAGLTKNSPVLVLLLLWAFPLPVWWMIMLSFGALAVLALDTYRLYHPQLPGFWLFVTGYTVLAGALNYFTPEGLWTWVANAALLLPAVGALLSWGGAGYVFDRGAYEATEFSFQQYALQQFRKNIPAMASVYVLGALILVAVYAPYIANDQPLYAQYRGETYYPAWTSVFEPTRVDTVLNEKGNPERLQFDIANWKQMKLDRVVWAPVPYSPGKSDRYNRDYAAPGGEQRYKTPDGEIVDAPRKFRHHLGTDQVGADVLAGLIHGTRISLTIGLISMGIATLIGVILGALSGYYGDTRLKTSRVGYWLVLLGIFLLLFYGGKLGRWDVGLLVFVAFIALGRVLGRLNLGWLTEETRVPMDTFVSRGIEILNSLPRLLIIITITAIFDRSMALLMGIIGLTSWTGIARFTRAEFLRTRSLEFIDAARSLGYSESRVIFRHALPNSLAPVFVSIAFGIASAILIESGLSFLGIGVPDDVVTWGQMLSKGRQEFEASWLVYWPGFAIFITVTAYNLIGEALRDALDPKLKR
jgi:peptide/nickel transport system permease protein